VIFRFERVFRHHFHRDFLSSNHLANDETRDAVEIPDWLADVCVANLRQLFHHAVDRLVAEVFSIAEAFGHEYPDQTRADNLVLLPGYFAVWVQPG